MQLQKQTEAQHVKTERFIDPAHLLEQIGLQEGMIIGDLGCGGGYIALAAGKLVGANGKIIAVDIQKPLLEDLVSKARLEGLSNIDTVWGDLEIVGSTRIAPGLCDVSILSGTLYQGKHREKMLEEAKRVTKAGGVVAVIEWKTSGIPFGPAVASRIQKSEVQRLAEAQGLHFEREFDASLYHYCMLFRV